MVDVDMTLKQNNAEHSQGLSSNSAENEARVASAKAEELEPVEDLCASFA